MSKIIDVWYLGHSGFAVIIEDTLLIFDYYLDDSNSDAHSLNSGVINLEEIKDKRVLIFSSHAHPDHFNPVILSWKEKLPNAELYLSSDISKKNHSDLVNYLKPNTIHTESNFTIQTFKSTDDGVAFLVTLFGIAIYHAGDLNWWHWDEEPEDWNNNMAASFKREIELIKGTPIDIAFLPADTRQEAFSLLGATYFLEKVSVKEAFPMHFWEDYSIMDVIESEAQSNPILKKIRKIEKRGDHFIINL